MRNRDSPFLESETLLDSTIFRWPWISYFSFFPIVSHQIAKAIVH